MLANVIFVCILHALQITFLFDSKRNHNYIYICLNFLYTFNFVLRNCSVPLKQLKTSVLDRFWINCLVVNPVYDAAFITAAAVPRSVASSIRWLVSRLLSQSTAFFSAGAYTHCPTARPVWHWSQHKVASPAMRHAQWPTQDSLTEWTCSFAVIQTSAW